MRTSLERGKEDSEGFGEFQALVFTRDGIWPPLDDLPAVVKDIFEQALEAERKQNPDADALACHLSVRIQGDAKAQEARDEKVRAVAEGRDPEVGDLHFDGHPGFGSLSEYFIAFSAPATIQYLGEIEISEGEQVDSAVKAVSANSLHAVSLLPRHLYHVTERTPHAEPTTLDTHVADDKPRLFMRLMFGKFDKTMGLTGRVYEA